MRVFFFFFSFLTSDSTSCFSCDAPAHAPLIQPLFPQPSVRHETAVWECYFQPLLLRAALFSRAGSDGRLINVIRAQHDAHDHNQI